MRAFHLFVTSTVVLSPLLVLVKGFAVRTLENSRQRVKSSALFVALPPNEFSRTVQPDKLLRSKTRDYKLEIEATKEECAALAQRFDLADISNLKASLTLRQEFVGQQSSGARTNGIEVEGSIVATVTQTCVRTNEKFSVDLELPLYSIVRPVIPIAALLQQQEEARLLENELRESTKDGSKRKQQKASFRPQQKGPKIDEMDMLELQRMLQQDISAEDDVLMEDEAIYALDGLFDVGELVSQLFWLQLDPYPKKPGTGPIQISISG